MYYYFNGILARLNSDSAVVECGGVGYLLSISGETYSKLVPRLETQNQTVKLYAYHHVREDTAELYGFYQEEECEIFKLLISVSGIGPRGAIAILSSMTARELALSIAAEDAKSIARAQGVGPKTAQKIILELKDKMAKRFDLAGEAYREGEPPVVPAAGIANEAISALTVLGYTRTEAVAAVNRSRGDSTEEIIRNALKSLMG